MSIYSRLDRIAADVEKLNHQVTAVSNSPQSQRTSVEGGSIDFNDADGNLMAIMGGQDDGSNTIRHVDGPTPPIPSGLSAHVDGPIVQVSWDGTFEDADTATYDWSHLEVIAVGPNSENLRATINDVTGATANLAATASGEWAVVARSVSRAEKRSLDGDAGTVEVKLVDIDGAIEAVQDSANGKNKVTYSDRPPTPADPGIFDDTWFVGQVGRPNDIIEATNLWRGSKLSQDLTTISVSASYSSVQTADGLQITGVSNPGTGAYSLTYTPGAGILSGIDPNGKYSWRIPFRNDSQRSLNLRVASWIRNSSGSNVATGTDYGKVWEPGEVKDVVIENMDAAGTGYDIRFSMYYGAGTDRPGVGDSFTILDGITLVQSETAPPFPFNGDTESGETNNESHYRWTGEPYASASEKYLPALDIGDSDNWNVIEQYRHDGTGWVKVELSHHVFSTVDLGKATVGELDGIRIMGQTIRGEQLSGDAIDGKVITGGTYRTSGGNSWSDAGLFIAKPDGTSMVRFPTDGSPLSLTASDTQIERASVGELDVSYGAVRSGGQLTLASGVAAPPSPPELTTGWQFEAKLARPAEPSMDWTGLAYWNGLYVRGVNVLGSAGDPHDRIELYNPDGTLNRSINIDLNPRAGVAVIGDIVYTVGPDHVAANAGKQWCHGFNLNTGARVSRWEFVNFFDPKQAKIALGNDGTNLVAAGVAPNLSLNVFRYNPSTGAQVGSQWLTVQDWPSSGGKELYGVRVNGNDVDVVTSWGARVYLNSNNVLVRKTDSANESGYEGWTLPAHDVSGCVWVAGVPYPVDSSGTVYEGAPPVSDSTIRMCYTWWDGTHETTPSPIATVQVPAWQNFYCSLPARAGLSKRVYVEFSVAPNVWYRTTVGEASTVASYGDFSGDAQPLPTTNTFPNADPATLKSTNDKFEVKGDGSGHWGPLTFNTDGSMSGINKTAAGRVIMSPTSENERINSFVTFPAGRFSEPPAVTATADSVVPERIIGIGASSPSSTGFRLYFSRTTVADTGVTWIAMEMD